MRIVCFHLNQVGDLVFSLPALKNLRFGLSEAHITSVVRPGLAELIKCSGLADNVLVRHRGAGAHKLELIRSLRRSRFDLAVVFSQSLVSVLLAYLSGAPRRVGFCGSSLAGLLTQQVPFQHPPSGRNNLRLVEAVGCAPKTVSYAGLLRPSAEQIAESLSLLSRYGVGSGDPIAGLAPGTSSRRDIKRWTDEGFAAVGRYLAGRGIKVVLLGSDTRSGVSICSDFVNLSGATDLVQALAVVARCKVVVGVDSGLLHLAAAAGTRVIGLYGPSDPEVTGPQGDGHLFVTAGSPCSPCRKTRCSMDRICMTQLTPDRVIAAVDKVLGASEPSPR